MFKKFLSKFSTFDLLVIALLSACGVATKPFMRILAQVFTGTLFSAGTVGGIFYMLWIVLACSIVKKRGTAFLVGLVQSVLVVVFDMLGNRGIANLLVYVVPTIALEFSMFLFPGYVSSLLSGFLAGAVTNTTGSLIVNTLFLRVPFIPLLISLLVSFLSGGVGGFIGYKLSGVVDILNKSKKAKASKASSSSG